MKAELETSKVHPEEMLQQTGSSYFFLPTRKKFKETSIFNLCTSEPKWTGHCPVEFSGENVTFALGMCNFNYASDMANAVEEPTSSCKLI